MIMFGFGIGLVFGFFLCNLFSVHVAKSTELANHMMMLQKQAHEEELNEIIAKLSPEARSQVLEEQASKRRLLEASRRLLDASLVKPRCHTKSVS
jgi:hypothetical protein